MKKRFIAGAVCPRCGEMDRLHTFEKEGSTIKECVSCGFTETQLVQVAVEELETRVNRSSDSDEQSQVDVVKIVSLKPK